MVVVVVVVGSGDGSCCCSIVIYLCCMFTLQSTDTYFEQLVSSLRQLYDNFLSACISQTISFVYVH